MAVVYVLGWSLDQTSLPDNLSSNLEAQLMNMLYPRLASRGAANLVVWQTRSGEDGNLLSSRDRVHNVDGGNTSLNHLLGVYTRVWVDRRAFTEDRQLRQTSLTG